MSVTIYFKLQTYPSQFDSSHGQFIWTCLLMVWLLPAGQGGFIGNVPVYRTKIFWLSSTSTALVTAVSRERDNLSRKMQQSRVVNFQLIIGRNASLMRRIMVCDGYTSTINGVWWWPFCNTGGKNRMK